jgi:hypothetical protein
VGDKEITLDDMWRLDLQKLDGWTLVQVRSATICDMRDGGIRIFPAI